MIPAEVIDWIRAVFSAVNRRISTKLTRFPTTHETSLDISFIEEVSQHSAPVQFSSGWLLRLETHYLGGGRYWGKWEIADIGVLIVFRKAGVVQQTKIALLQSKRLYPIESQTTAEVEPIDYIVGFGRLLPAEQEYKSSVKQRSFSFVEESRYRAFEYKGQQYNAILKYHDETGVPVHYLFYNPSRIPVTVAYPVQAQGGDPPNEPKWIGARIASAQMIDETLKTQNLKDGENPAFRDVFADSSETTSAPWPLEYFIADLVLGCKEGHVAGVNPMEDEALFTVFNRRSGPISAAIAITIDSPVEAA